MEKKTCIIIAGPTAVGKTAFAIDLANRLNTQIISADSRQCYNELNIGVAKPDKNQLQFIIHHFINSHSVYESVNAKVFEAFALHKAEEIFQQKDNLVLVGGTGLYIKAFIEGLDDIPEVNIKSTEEIKINYQKKGLAWLQDELKNHDPLFFKKGDILNPHRAIRALAVKKSSGKSIIEYQTNNKIQRPFDIIKVGLELPRGKLNQRINTRVDQMINDGLLDEVISLRSQQSFQALQTVGYKELFEYLKGKINLQEAIEQIKTNTRQYAKRQMTWFKKDQDINWLDASLPYDILIGKTLEILSAKI